MKNLLFFFAFFISLSSFTQDFRYEFTISGVTEPAEAKYKINEIRELLGVSIMRFNDEIDQFVIETHLDYDVVELTADLSEIGIVLIGEIHKINVE